MFYNMEKLMDYQFIN